MAENKEKLKGRVLDLWGKTKKDLENVLAESVKLIKKGEGHIKDFSEKGKIKIEIMNLKLKRENLYYKLGKTVASTVKNKWSASSKIEKLRLDIIKATKDIKRKESSV
ncbi:MAG: hypothetical protein PHQ54_01530 [Candidatus Omnitrophica bacterium]|nr:hypothetical protein [Candidatus Omnitrophota bacterium]